MRLVFCTGQSVEVGSVREAVTYLRKTSFTGDHKNNMSYKVAVKQRFRIYYGKRIGISDKAFMAALHSIGELVLEQ